MLRHSSGNTLGNTRIHTKVYRREKEFYNKLDQEINFIPSDTDIDNLMTINGYDEHYKNIYNTRNREVIEFFYKNSKDNFFHCRLEDKEKWIKLGLFMGLEIPNDFDIHLNKSRY